MTRTGASHLLGTLHRPMQLLPGPSGRVWYTAFARVPSLQAGPEARYHEGDQPVERQSLPMDTCCPFVPTDVLRSPLLSVFPPHVVSPLKQPSVRLHV